MDWDAFDKFMESQGFKFATEEGGPGPGPESPYRRTYYNPETEEAFDIVECENTADLSDCIEE